MASAVASSMPMPAAAVSYGWLGPRLSFGRDPVVSPAAADHGPPECKTAADQVSAVSKEFIDFEFSLGGSATMLPADELFADGKLLPLRPHPATEVERQESAPAAEIPATTPELVKTHRPSSVAEAFDPYVFSPKAPTCSSRWRELLRLRKVQTPPPPQKPSASQTPSQSRQPRPERPTPRQRGPSSCSSSSGIAAGARLTSPQRRRRSSATAPTPRRPSPSPPPASPSPLRRPPPPTITTTSPAIRSIPSTSPRSPASVSSAPNPNSTAIPPPPPSSAPPRAVHSPARRRPATTPPPPSVASVDSPRMNSSGKIVFQGLERSSSSPAGSVHSSLRSRSRVMDRSYSTPVVLNVPVCSRPSFGFFKDKKDTAGKDAAARLRSSLGRKTTTTHPAGGSSVSCRDLGAGKCN